MTARSPSRRTSPDAAPARDTPQRPAAQGPGVPATFLPGQVEPAPDGAGADGSPVGGSPADGSPADGSRADGSPADRHEAGAEAVSRAGADAGGPPRTSEGPGAEATLTAARGDAESAPPRTSGGTARPAPPTADVETASAKTARGRRAPASRASGGARSKAADVKPADDAKPGSAKPVDAKPADTSSADTKPADTKPADTSSAGPSVSGRKAGGPKPADVRAAGPSPQAAGAPKPSGSPGVRPAPPMEGWERDRLLAGTHHDPHGPLGAHAVPGGVLFRALRPYATSVTVLAPGIRAELPHEGDGLFAGVLPLPEIPEYELLIAYDGAEVRTHDPYRFLPALGELDLHLIAEGWHEQLWHALGARPMTHQGVTGTRFTVWAPNAQGVRVTGNFNYWDGTGFPMRSLGSSGVWELFVPGLGEGELYKFDIARPDGSHTLRADPMARRTEAPPANASVVDVSRHEWHDQEWMSRRAERPVHQAPFSVYEVHLASWRPGLSYREIAEQLPAYVAELGFTHVELLPVAEHPFGGSWGYQVTGFYAPTARLGTPDDFRYLVDTLHQAGIGVLMDWVPAHFPRDDWALAEFDGRTLYEHEDPARAAHPDWGTLEFDYGRTEVRNFLVANAVYWCEEFHIDGLRVDAVASMLYLDYSRESGEWTPNVHGGRENLDAVAFLQEMNATVYRRCPGVVTIAEESTAWDGVTRATHHTGPGGFGGLGFGLKWNMGWMHDSLVYMSKEPVHRKYHHGEMTFAMVYAYSENYVLPISHDEVVHGKRSLVSKMPGDWWQQRANHRAYLGYMWAHPGKQLLFMGQEFAQGAEWSESGGPDWWLLDPAYPAEPDHRGVRDLVRDLNARYRETPALWERDTDPGGFRWIDGSLSDDNVFPFIRYDAEGAPLISVSNFSPVVREGYRLGVPEHVTGWREVLNTDESRYGGSGVINPGSLLPTGKPAHGFPVSLAPVLPPLATIWLRPA
ncbi:1,4-alpha-glucan branching enzyme [Streptomyces sp. NPDC003077]|uniref:1,4-alpha-glucan branching enzyme n=1 Tax=Streptomyces sp. NPDC003077 TaxID=3154443 RepID=UPI0033BD3549